MAALNDLTIRIGGLTVLAQDHPLGLPPSYSMQAIKDQVPGATLSPDGYKALYYPAWATRHPTGSLFEVLSYVLQLVPEMSLQTLDALYEDLEGKAWENWSQITGLSSANRHIPPHAFSQGISPT